MFQDGTGSDFPALRPLLDSLAHRGPDAAGEWRADGVYMGHRRLSIIDLTTGDQPMASADGRYVVVFNGEIYNFRELRRRLIDDGAAFKTQSDTEVILEGYRRWSTGVVEHLEGMFAFVLWDRRERAVFAARDRLGIKPLCWSWTGNSLVIASTLEPFVSLGRFSRLNLPALRDLLALDYVPSPRTILEGVQKLEPGTRLEWRPGSAAPAIDGYWKPPVKDPSSKVPDDFEIEHLLERSVKQQMVSDVPIGAFLSGGVDSSLLVALMARHSGRPVRTFSVAYEDPEFDESSTAALVAERFGTEHVRLPDRGIASEELIALLGRLDEPFCDPTFVPLFALSEMTRRHVKVALSGDGGDEIFGGYAKYLTPGAGHGSRRLFPLVDRSLRTIRWRPRGASRFYSLAAPPEERRRFSSARYGDFPVFRKDMRQLLTRRHQEGCEIEDYFDYWEKKAARYGDASEADVLMRVDLETYLSENCLVKTDRASMLASLEVRVPYLDEELVDRIAPLPAEKKIHDGRLKALLMPVAQRLLPEAVWNRPKHGFNVPLDKMLARPWRAAVERALDWGERNFDLFDYRYLRRLHAINLCEGGVSRELWSPFVVIAWAMARSEQGVRLEA